MSRQPTVRPGCSYGGPRVSYADFAAVRCNREISAFVSAAFGTKGGKSYADLGPMA
jgi:hypothetical protein